MIELNKQSYLEYDPHIPTLTPYKHYQIMSCMGNTLYHTKHHNQLYSYCIYVIGFLLESDVTECPLGCHRRFFFPQTV